MDSSRQNSHKPTAEPLARSGAVYSEPVALRSAVLMMLVKREQEEEEEEEEEDEEREQ